MGGVKHTYMLDGTKVLKEVWGSNTLIPLYDNEDSVCGIVYNGEPYYFVKNLQGDVIAIVDEDVETVAKYSYDAWGVCTVVSDTSECAIATINPYRYRGYYYDDEIGMYYLQSRYYNPVVGRFINADDAIIAVLTYIIHVHNLFDYCSSNPCCWDDPLGFSFWGVISFAQLALSFIASVVVLLALLNWMSSQEFQQSWSAFCTTVGNGLSWIGTSISNGGQTVWSWTKSQVKAATAAIDEYISIAKAESKVVSKTKSARRNQNRFFEIWFDRIGTPILGRSLNRDQAVTRARRGLNSITYFSSDARYVANRAGGARAMWHQRHGGDGYFNHYHINGHKNSAHIFYVVAG